MSPSALDPARVRLHALVAAIEPLDQIEIEHRRTTLSWIESGAPLWRTAKPATPPRHVVAYAVLVDPDRRTVLLGDHRLAGRWLPTGGHIEPGEDPGTAARRELTEELAISAPSYPSADPAPVMVTVTVTEGLDSGHEDVSLWYVFAGSHRLDLQPDPAEFNAVRWWTVEEVAAGPGNRFDVNLPRFLTKLATSGDAGW